MREINKKKYPITANILLIVTVVILTILLVLTLFCFLISEYQNNINSLNQLDTITKHFEKDLETYTEFTNNYNMMKNDYDELFNKYQILDQEKNFNWDTYEVTGYTSLDEETSNMAYTGIDISLLNNYINIVAVDPNYISLGSIVVIKYNDLLLPALALDIGGAVKGKHIDLYFGYDKERAFEFGKQQLEVGILK